MKTTNPGQYEELTRLGSTLLDGRLSDAERARLEALLTSDAQARGIYLQMIDQEIELSCLITAPAQHPSSEGMVPVARAQNACPELTSTSSPHPSLPSEGGEGARRAGEEVRRRTGRLRRLAAAAAVLVFITVAMALVSQHFGKRKASPGPSIAVSPVLWSEDFEQGSLTGWLGTRVSTNLPAGSRYGVAAAIEQWPEGAYHMIRLPEKWAEGLFTLGERDSLRITYRFARGSHVNVFLHVISPGDARPGMFQLRPAQSPRCSTEWQTTAIPFSAFARKVRLPDGRMEFSGGAPIAGERVAYLAFSSPDEIDFVIDRIWVTSEPVSQP